MKNVLITAILLLVQSSAFAQSQVSSQTQIIQARDYVGSLLNQISTGAKSADFAASTDYAQAGLDLQNRVSEKLTQFKSTMANLATGSFARSIDQYNELVRETSISENEKTERLALLFKSLEVQASAAKAAYHAALESLYAIEPSWTLVSKNSGASAGRIVLSLFSLGIAAQPDDEVTRFHFADGTTVRRVQNSDAKSVVSIRVSKTLEQRCRSKLCMTSMLADYAYYFSSVVTQLDHDLTIELNDGHRINLPAIGGGKSNYIMDVISGYSFENQKYSKLPDSVSN